MKWKLIQQHTIVLGSERDLTNLEIQQIYLYNMQIATWFRA